MDEFHKRLQKMLDVMRGESAQAEHGAVLSGDFVSAAKMATRVETLESIQAQANQLFRKLREDG